MLALSVLATSVGIAIHRAIVAPQIKRYLAWRNGPRVQIARPDWRGVYVPDLTIMRVERAVKLMAIVVVLFGLTVTIAFYSQFQ